MVRSERNVLLCSCVALCVWNGCFQTIHFDACECFCVCWAEKWFTQMYVRYQIILMGPRVQILLHICDSILNLELSSERLGQKSKYIGLID